MNATLFDEQSCHPEQQHAGQHAAEHGHGHGFAGCVFLYQFGDLKNDLEDRACADGEEQHGQERLGREAADPRADDGRSAADESHEGESSDGGPVA